MLPRHKSARRRAGRCCGDVCPGLALVANGRFCLRFFDAGRCVRVRPGVRSARVEKSDKEEAAGRWVRPMGKASRRLPYSALSWRWVMMLWRFDRGSAGQDRSGGLSVRSFWLVRTAHLAARSRSWTRQNGYAPYSYPPRRSALRRYSQFAAGKIRPASAGGRAAGQFSADDLELK